MKQLWLDAASFGLLAIFDYFRGCSAARPGRVVIIDPVAQLNRAPAF